MVPMNDPPIEYATFKRDDEACFNELVDPMPTSEKNQETGLPSFCNQVTPLSSSHSVKVSYSLISVKL